MYLERKEYENRRRYFDRQGLRGLFKEKRKVGVVRTGLRRIACADKRKIHSFRRHGIRNSIVISFDSLYTIAYLLRNMADDEPISRRTRSKTPITPKSEREIIHSKLLAVEIPRQTGRRSDNGGPAKRRKKNIQSIKRRIGKTHNLSSSTNLEDLPDDVFLKIFDFVTASDGNYLPDDKIFTEDAVIPTFPNLFTGQWREHGVSRPVEIQNIVDRSNALHLIKKISATPSSPVASLISISSLLCSAPLVSKRFKRSILFYLNNVLIDADFFGVSRGHELGCILWMMKKRLSISRVRVKACFEDAHLLASLLIHCDTSELRAFDVKFSKDYREEGFISSAWWSKFGSDVVDLSNITDAAFGKSENERLWDLGIARSDYFHAKLSEEEFFKVAAVECASIELLSITMEIDPYKPQLESHYERMVSSPSLKYVDLNIRLPEGAQRGTVENSDEPVLLYPGLTRAIALAPNLSGLRIGNAPPPLVSENYGFSIESDSLELIDLTMVASKDTFVLRCICPKLRNFFCGTFHSSNGVLPLGFDVSRGVFWSLGLNFHWSQRAGVYCLPASYGFYGFEVPSDCIIHLSRALYLPSYRLTTARRQGIVAL